MSLSTAYPAVRPALLLDFARAQSLDPRITFTRASPAVRYDGVTTARAEENLFTYSQELVTNWALFASASRATGVVDPAGGTTAVTITKGTDNIWAMRQDLGYPRTSRTFTMSFYMKGTGTLTLRVDNYINQAINQQITLSSTWTRYTFTFTFNATAGDLVAAGFGFQTGDTATSVDVAFAQLEERNAATAYTATTTQPVTTYIPVLQTVAAGVPRFDFDPITDASLGLLIEEARTNDIAVSADFANAVFWAPINGTVTSNTVIAPDGTLTGDKLIANTVNAQHRIQISTAMTSGTSYTFSVYAKISDANYTQIWMRTANDVVQAFFNLANGTVGNPIGGTGTASITAVGNGWYRCSVTATAGSTGSLISRINVALSNGAIDYIGNNWAGVFLWGAQIEAGSFATSYIATAGTAQTRNADVATMTGTNFSSWFNNSQGTFVLTSTFEYAGPSAFPYLLVAVGSDANLDALGIYTRTTGVGASSGQTFALSVINTVTQANMQPSGQTVLGATRAAFAYQTDNFAVTCFGLTPDTDTGGAIPTCVALRIYGAARFQAQPTGRIQRIAYYDVRLTNAQLQALTLS